MKQFEVTADSLNIREKPKLTGKILGALRKDEPVDWISNRATDNWQKIKSADGTVG